MAKTRMTAVDNRTLAEIEERAKRRKDKPLLGLIAAIKKADKAHKNPIHTGDGVPAVGSDIYVQTRIFIDHGEDDVMGGLAEVVKVKMGMSAGDQTPFVYVKEHGSSGYNWNVLKEEQEKLKKEFGKKRAYEDPDYGPEND